MAERIRKIGKYAPATLKQFLELTHLSEELKNGNSSQAYIQELLEDHDIIIQYIRENISQVEEEYKDFGTADFLTGLLQEHESMAWMLRASISKEKSVETTEVC